MFQKIFWRQSDWNLPCLGNEAFLPGKVTGFWAELQAPSACQSKTVLIGDGCVQAELMSTPRSITPRVTARWVEWEACVELIK